MTAPPYDLVVVGAGAAGLWAAGTATALGARVLVLEKTARSGTKILASGGSRCNLTTTLGPDEAARLFGAAERFLQPSLRALPPARVREVFHRLGVPTVEEPHLEKVFPRSQRADDVRDALLRRAEGVRVVYNTPVLGVEPSDGGWAIRLAQGTVRAPRVMLCAGGRSYPRTGTTGDGYAWLTALGLPVVQPVPALVPLTSPAGWVRNLSGVALQHTEARLHAPDGRILARRARPVLFTHHGLSGPGAMDLSGPVARAVADGRAAGWSIAVDLVPQLPEDGLRRALADAAGQPGGPRLARVVGDAVPERLREAACRQAGLTDPNPPLHQVDRKARNRLADALKGLVVPVDGTLGWDKAEVTAGGLALDAVDRTSLGVRGHPGLSVVGELLDLTGPIGGLNFQAAFATADAAARHAFRG